MVKRSAFAIDTKSQEMMVAELKLCQNADGMT